jgi:hypothetical protein
VLSPEGDIERIIGSETAGEASGVYFHGDELFVCDGARRDVQAFDVGSGRFLYRFGKENLSMPIGICVHNGNAWVTDIVLHQVLMFDLKSGGLLKTLGSKGNGKTEFMAPTCLRVVDDRVFVGDAGNERLQVLSTAGEFMYSVHVGAKTLDMAFHDMELFLLDATTEEVIVVDPATSKRLRTFGRSGGDEPGEFDQPSGLAILLDQLYVCDSTRIQCFR